VVCPLRKRYADRDAGAHRRPAARGDGAPGRQRPDRREPLRAPWPSTAPRASAGGLGWAGRGLPSPTGHRSPRTAPAAVPDASSRPHARCPEAVNLRDPEKIARRRATFAAARHRGGLPTSGHESYISRGVVRRPPRREPIGASTPPSIDVDQPPKPDPPALAGRPQAVHLWGGLGWVRPRPASGDRAPAATPHPRAAGGQAAAAPDTPAPSPQPPQPAVEIP